MVRLRKTCWTEYSLDLGKYQKAGKFRFQGLLVEHKIIARSYEIEQLGTNIIKSDFSPI